MSKQKLGRGLEAILSPLTANTNNQNTENIINIAIDKIKPNKYQPRAVFDEEKLKDLAEEMSKNCNISFVSSSSEKINNIKHINVNNIYLYV